MKHAILRDLGILDEIEWLPTGPVHQVRGGPVGESFALPTGFDAAYDALAERFPDKRSAIQEFLADVERIHDSLWTIRQARDTGSLAKFTRALWELAPAAAAWNDTLDEVFTQRFGGAEALKCALGANLLYFGDDPKRIWWIYYALAQGANIASGGAYIKGGSRQLSLKLAKVITKSGGVVRLGRAATAILTNGDGEATGVRHVARKTGEDEEEISARVVLANCAPSVAGELLPAPARALMEEEFGARPLSTSLFSANFGLAQKPATVGLTDFNAIVLPETMTRFSQYGDGAGAMAVDPAGALPLYSIANFTAVDSGLWDSRRCWQRARARQFEQLERPLARGGAGAARTLAGCAPGRDGAGLCRLFRPRQRARAAQRLFHGGLSQHAAGRGLWLRAAAAGSPDHRRLSAHAAYAGGRAHLASAFGGEHRFNGAILSGAEAARLAAAELEMGRGDPPAFCSLVKGTLFAGLALPEEARLASASRKGFPPRFGIKRWARLAELVHMLSRRKAPRVFVMGLFHRSRR